MSDVVGAAGGAGLTDQPFGDAARAIGHLYMVYEECCLGDMSERGLTILSHLVFALAQAAQAIKRRCMVMAVKYAEQSSRSLWTRTRCFWSRSSVTSGFKLVVEELSNRLLKEKWQAEHLYGLTSASEARLVLRYKQGETSRLAFLEFLRCSKRLDLRVMT